MQRVIDYVNTSANYAYTVRDEGWVGDPPFVCYHLDTCDIGHCAPGCPCTHVMIEKEVRSPWARPIEKEKVMDTPEQEPEILSQVIAGGSVGWGEVSRALEVLSIDTTHAIRVEMDQRYVFVTQFARHPETGQILSAGRNTLRTQTTRYEIDLTR